MEMMQYQCEVTGQYYNSETNTRTTVLKFTKDVSFSARDMVRIGLNAAQERNGLVKLRWVSVVTYTYDDNNWQINGCFITIKELV